MQFKEQGNCEIGQAQWPIIITFYLKYEQAVWSLFLLTDAGKFVQSAVVRMFMPLTSFFSLYFFYFFPF